MSAIVSSATQTNKRVLEEGVLTYIAQNYWHMVIFLKKTSFQPVLKIALKFLQTVKLGLPVSVAQCYPHSGLTTSVFPIFCRSFHISGERTLFLQLQNSLLCGRATIYLPSPSRRVDGLLGLLTIFYFYKVCCSEQLILDVILRTCKVSVG